MTKYARDEFDKVPETASRQGVHRTASAPSRVRLWPVLAVGVAALAIGLVSFLVLPKLGFSTAGNQASVSQEAVPLAGTGTTPTATADPSPASAATTTPAADGPAAGAEPEEEAATAPASPASSVDKSQGVAIYNAAGTAGLAGRVGGTVQADGWTLGQVGNWAGAPQQTSIIFYAGPQQLANARALATLLNVPTLVDSMEFQLPLVVVLGPGYQ